MFRICGRKNVDHKLNGDLMAMVKDKERLGQRLRKEVSDQFLGLNGIN